jgi:hypothetical protein
VHRHMHTHTLEVSLWNNPSSSFTVNYDFLHW